MKLLKAGKPAAAAQQFDLWTKAGGKVLPGLVKRRAAEKELFNAKAN
jgi:lysozyme